MLDENKNVKIIDLGLGNFFDMSGDKLLDTFWYCSCATCV